MPLRTIAGTLALASGGALATTVVTFRPIRGRWAPGDLRQAAYTVTTDATGQYVITLHSPATYEVTAAGMTAQRLHVSGPRRAPACTFGLFVLEYTYPYRIRDICQAVGVNLFSSLALFADDPTEDRPGIDAAIDAGLRFNLRVRANNDGTNGATLAPTDNAGRAAFLHGVDVIMARHTPGGRLWGDAVDFLTIESEANLVTHYQPPAPPGPTSPALYDLQIAAARTYWGDQWQITDSGLSQGPLYHLLMQDYRATGEDDNALRLANILYTYNIDGWTTGPYPTLASIDAQLAVLAGIINRASNYLQVCPNWVHWMNFHNYLGLNTVAADGYTEATWALGQALDRIYIPATRGLPWGSFEWGIWSQVNPPYTAPDGNPDDIARIPTTIYNSPTLAAIHRGAGMAVYYSADVPAPERARGLTTTSDDTVILRDSGLRFQYIRDMAGGV